MASLWITILIVGMISLFSAIALIADRQTIRRLQKRIDKLENELKKEDNNE